jgi:hypothetical protein
LLTACRAHPRDTWQLRSCPEPEGGRRSRGNTRRPRSCPELGCGSRSHETHSAPEATLSQKAGVRAQGIRDGPGAALSFYLDLKLVRGGYPAWYRQLPHKKFLHCIDRIHVRYLKWVHLSCHYSFPTKIKNKCIIVGETDIKLWSVWETSFPNSSPQNKKKIVSLTLSSLVAILLPSRYEYLTDGLKRRDVPTLRVPSHLIKGKSKCHVNIVVSEFSIKRKQSICNASAIPVFYLYLVIFIEIISCVASNCDEGSPRKPQVRPEIAQRSIIGDQSVH